MAYDPRSSTSSQSSFDAPDDTEKYVLATIPVEESSGLLPTILLVSLLLLIGLVSLLWLNLGRPSIGPPPTPTQTATVNPTQAAITISTPTPNTRATEVIELISTRAAADLANNRPDLATVVAILVSTGVVPSDILLTPATTPLPSTATPVTPPTATPGNVAQIAPTEEVEIDPTAETSGSGDERDPLDGSEILLPIVESATEEVALLNEGTVLTTTPAITSTAILTTVVLPPTISDTEVITQSGEVTTTVTLTETNNISNTGSTTSTVNLPVIVGRSEDKDEPATPTSTATHTPTAEAIETPTATSTVTNTAPITTTESITLTATVTPTLAPTDTPTPEPTPTPTATTVQVFASLKGKAVSDRGDIRVYKGPSRIYEALGIITAEQEVRISDRDKSGEWLYVCCDNNNVDGWVRQVDVPPTGNTLEQVLGTAAAAELTATPEADRPDPNDVGWLRERGALSSPARPVWPAIPSDHYVLHRYNPGNQANGPLPQLPKNGDPPIGSLQKAWERRQGKVLTSAAVTDKGVYITSDNGHLYKLNIANGEEVASHRFDSSPNTVNAPFAIFDQTIYAASSGNQLYAINELDLKKIWSRPIVSIVGNQPLTPITGINILAGKLYFGATDGANQYLVSADRNEEGKITFTSPVAGGTMQYPAIGNQLVYVGNERVTALDAHDGSEVWIQDEPQGILAPPVYSQPGVVALAELYVAASNQAIFALDANTGAKIWSISAGDTISGLALDNTTIYAAVDTEIKAFARTDGEERWTKSVLAPIVGGPSVSGNNMIFVTNDGTIHYLNTSNGDTLFSSPFVGDTVTIAPAMNNKYIFVPGENGKLFAWEGE